MTTITFDTLKFVKKLEASGLPDKQSEAIAEAFKEAQGEADLATKADIKELEYQMQEMEQRMTIKLGTLMALAIGIVATLDKIL